MKRKSWLFWSALGTGVLLILAVGTAIGYAAYFAERVLPGVSVLDESVTGMDRSDLQQMLDERLDATVVDITLDGETSQVPIEELGYAVDTEAMVDEAFRANGSFTDRFRALATPMNVESVVTFTPEVQSEYSQSLEAKAGSPAMNASVSLDKENYEYVVTPGEAGTTLDAHLLNDAAEQAAETLLPEAVTLDLAEVDPIVTTADAEKVVAAANRIIEAPVELTTTLNVYSPDGAEKASWVQIPAVFSDGPDQGEADQTVLAEVTINKKEVADWVEQTTTASNDDPVPGLRNVNSRGDVVQVVSKGESGWVANNTAELTQHLLDALPDGAGFTEQIQYDEVKNTEWEEQTIADGAEDLAYQAAKGEKWIDINLSNFTTTAYEGATVVRGPVSMVPGAPGTETVTGKYEVWAKVATQTMRGDNLDGTKYETPDVPWILYFHGGYALHGAYWRDSFGYGGPAGSHGCVNMPVSEAKWFYDWASVGTPVVSHY